MSFAKKSVLAVLLFVSVVALAAQTIYYQTSNLSSFKYFLDKDGQLSAEKIIQNYDLVRQWGGGDYQNYLLDTQLRNKEFMNLDGIDGDLKWTVRSGDKFQNVLYTKTEHATDYGLSDLDAMMVTGLDGCCDSRTGYRLYDVTNGKLLISFNDFIGTEVVRHPFTLDIPNSKLGYRFIGLINGESTRDQDFVAPQAGYMNTLLLKYASKTNFFQRLQIDMQVKDGFAPSVMDVQLEADPTAPGSGSIEFRDGIASLWNIDGATDPNQIQGVQLKMVLNGGDDDKVVIIPVIQDRLSLDKAQVPAGVTLKNVP